MSKKGIKNVKNKGMRWQVGEKAMRVILPNGDDTRVKVTFIGDYFTPQEFTSIYMALLECYTESLLQTNDRKAIYNHFNNAFGIYLNKLLSDKEVYETSPKHKEAKVIVENTLGKPETKEVKEETEDNRLAALIVAKELLLEAGLTEETANALIAKKAGLITPTRGGEGVVN